MSVKVDITMSLDGFVAGPNASLEQPLGEGGEQLHEWMVNLASWRRPHGLEGGETGPEDDLFRAFTESNGAFVMGRNMFSGGFGPGRWADDPNPNGWWGDEPPFRGPVFVVTHHEREPLVLGETTFHFVTDGVDAAVARAREAAGERDVLISGGAEIVQQALEARLVDELHVHVAPLLLGGGTRLFDGPVTELELVELVESPRAAHLRYRLR
jgi:dihydrofolate reductase